MRGLSTLGFFVAIALLRAAPALAQDAGMEECSPPTELGPLEFFPASGAGGVALDSAVRVRYTPGFFDVWRDPLTRLLEVRDASDTPVRGVLDRMGDTLVFRPDEPWRAGSAYTGTAFGIDILQARFNFRTGTIFDVQPPVFGGVPTVTPAHVDAHPCVDGGGYRIDVAFVPAADSDGAEGDIEYLLFQTRGPGLERPVLRSRVRNFAGVSITLAFTLAPNEAVAPVCVAVIAVDGVGHTVEGPTACVDPIQGNFFEPLCSVAPPGSARRAAPGSAHESAPWAAGAVLLAGICAGVRRARRPR